MGKTISKKTIQAVLAGMMSLSNCWGMEEVRTVELFNPFTNNNSQDCVKLIIENMVDEREITIKDFVSFSSTCKAVHSREIIQGILKLFQESMKNRKIMEEKLQQIISKCGFRPSSVEFDCSTMNLMKQDLRFLFFSADRNVYESSINFSRANLAGVILQGRSLLGCNFEGTILKNADARDTDLSDFKKAGHQWWSPGIVIKTTFSNANVQGILLKGAKIQERCLKEAEFSVESLEGVDLIPEVQEKPFDHDHWRRVKGDKYGYE